MKPKNIVILTTHDLGKHLSVYGIETVHTPNFDRMAREGAVFSRNFCVSPACSPSRATIFTGRYPHCNGVMGLTHGEFMFQLNADEQHLAMVLQREGFDTAIVGICHENNRVDTLGFQATVVREGGALARVDDPRRNEAHLDALELADRADYFFAQAVQSEKPFLFVGGFFEAHRAFDFKGCLPDRERGMHIPPYIPTGTPEEKTAAEEEFAGLQGMIKRLDQGVGRILDSLERHGLKDDTVVLFTADHGIAMPRAKCSLFDPGIECALLLWGGGISAGARHDALISNVDFFPTLLGSLGLPVSARVQGRSFLPLLRNEPYTARTEIFAEKTFHTSYDPQRCIRTNRYKYVLNFEVNTLCDVPTDARFGPVYRTGIKHFLSKRPRESLYDLEADPWERENLANRADHIGIQTELRARLHAWMKETDDPLLKGPVESPYHRATLALLE